MDKPPTDRQRMTADELTQIGVALYGATHWKAQLARTLGYGNRTVQRWATGSWDVPDELPGRLTTLVERRIVTLTEKLAKLKELQP